MSETRSGQQIDTIVQAAEGGPDSRFAVAIDVPNQSESWEKFNIAILAETFPGRPLRVAWEDFAGRRIDIHTAADSLVEVLLIKVRIQTELTIDRQERLPADTVVDR